MRAFFLLLLVPLVFSQNCTEYCANITAACTGSNIQFPVPDTSNFCEASCWAYPLNSTLATGGDSYECRVYHITLASTGGQNAVTHCPHAGFDGANVCGDACQAYCDNILFACTGANTVFTNRDSCMQECTFFPVLGKNTANNATQPTENTLECRSWHSIFGLGTNATSVHCPHASPIGGGVCGSACDNYCDTVWDTCTGNLSQWSDRTQCLKACMSWPTTPASTPSTPVTAGDSYACRKYHAVVANTSLANAAYHCIHTGPLGGYGVCGTACSGYCDLLVKAGCSTNATQCLTDCASFPASSPVTTENLWNGNLSMDSLECRTRYVLLALEGDNSKCTGAHNGGDLCGNLASSVQVAWGLLALLSFAVSLAL